MSIGVWWCSLKKKKKKNGKNDDADEVLLILKDTAAKNVYITGRSQAVVALSI